MNELSPTLRSIIDAGTAGLEPHPGDRDRLRGPILAAAAAAAGTSLIGGTATAATAKAGGLTGTKLALVLVTAAAVGGGGLAIDRAWRSQPAAERRAVIAAPAEPLNSPTLEPIMADRPLAVSEGDPEPAIVEESAPEPSSPDPAARPAVPPRIEPVEVAPPSPNTLALEMRLLRTARRSLARGQAEAALTALAEHRRQFPDGELAPEAARVQIEALCAAGRLTDAAATAAAMAERWPSLPPADDCWKGDR